MTTSVNSKQLATNRTYLNLLIRVVFRIENRILASSSASWNMLSNVFSSIKSVSLSKESQYLASRHSLYEIEIFTEKSALDIAPFASEIFAPILVPRLNYCFESTNSLFSLLRNWYPLTILIANRYALSYKLFSIPTDLLFWVSSVSENLSKPTPYKKEFETCSLLTI